MATVFLPRKACFEADASQSKLKSATRTPQPTVRLPIHTGFLESYILLKSGILSLATNAVIVFLEATVSLCNF